MSSQNSAQILDDFIAKLGPSGDLSFDDDDSNDLFEAVARFANNARPLPTNPDEIDDFLESIPLFATRMPENGTESTAFKAIKSMMGDSDKVNLAEQVQSVGSMKDNGNNSYRLAVRLAEPKPNEKREDTERRLQTRKKKIYEALNFYHTGIENKHTLVVDENTSQEDNDRLLSQIYGNIAACHLLLENCGHCVDECKNAIKLNKGNIKAYYRMASALFKLHKYQPAFISVQQGLHQCIAVKATAEYKGFVTLAQKIVLAWKRHDDFEQQKIIKAQLAREQSQKDFEEVKAAFEKRRIVVGTGQFSKDSAEFYSKGRLYVGPKKELHFPVIFLYPDMNQSDFLQDVDEYTTMQDLINLLFPIGGAPAPWDKKAEYNQSSIEVYCYVHKDPSSASASNEAVDDKNGIKTTVPMKVGLGHALGTLCKKGYVVPRFPTFYITLKK